MKINEINNETLDLIPFKDNVSDLTYCSNTHLAIWYENKDNELMYFQNYTKTGPEFEFLNQYNKNIRLYNIIDSNIYEMVYLLEIIFITKLGKNKLKDF